MIFRIFNTGFLAIALLFVATGCDLKNAKYEAGTIVGSVGKGLAVEGTVTIYDKNGNSLGTSPIGTDGRYEVKSSYMGKTSATADITKYHDEALNTQVDISNLELKAITKIDETDRVINITILTNVAYKILEAKNSLDSSDSLIAQVNSYVVQATTGCKDYNPAKADVVFLNNGDGAQANTCANKAGLAMASLSSNSAVVAGSGNAGANKNSVNNTMTNFYNALLTAHTATAPLEALVENPNGVSISGINTDLIQAVPVPEFDVARLLDVEIETKFYSLSPVPNVQLDENIAYDSGAMQLLDPAVTPSGNLVYTLGGADASSFNIDAGTGQVTSKGVFGYEENTSANNDSIYELSVTSTDDKAVVSTINWIVTVLDVIEAKALVINNLASSNLDENLSYTSTTPTVSGDPIGDVVFIITGDDKHLFSINPTTGVVTANSLFDFETPIDSDKNNQYKYVITATDKDGNTISENIVITLVNIVELSNFTINPVTDQKIAENSAYYSPAPTIAGSPVGVVTWTIASGNDMAMFTIDGSTGVVSMVARDFEAPADNDTNNIYELMIKATDANTNDANHSFAVEVLNMIETIDINITNVANSAIDENDATYTVSPGVDGAQGVVTFNLSGDDEGLFVIDTASGNVSIATGFDFENPTDKDKNNIYKYTIDVVDDDNNKDSKDVQLTINDIVEASVFTVDTMNDATFPENIIYYSIAPTMSGDTPAGQITWTKSGVDAGLFTIDSITGQVSLTARDFEAPIDADTNNTYEITIIATDKDGNDANESFTVNIADSTEVVAFTINDIPDKNDLDENTTFTSTAIIKASGTQIGELHFSLEGDDKEKFEITGAGEVKFNGGDYEFPTDKDKDNIYEVIVKATDDDGNEATDNWNVTVLNVNEVNNFTISTIPNSSVLETNIYYGPIPQVVNNTSVLSWSLGGTDAGLFTIDTTTGQVQMIARDFEAPVDLNTDNKYEITLTAKDQDNNEENESYTVSIVDMLEVVALSIDGVANSAIDENDGTYQATPNVVGSHIGTLTFSLDGKDKNFFAIDSSTGNVTMIAVDFEAIGNFDKDNNYKYTIKVVDSDQNEATKDVVVTVNNITEGGAVIINTIPDVSIKENDDYTSNTPTIDKTDPANLPSGDVNWTLSGQDAGLFTINSTTGAITLITQADFEVPTDGAIGGDNTLNITLTATDADSHTDTESFVVTVLDIAEERDFNITTISDAIVLENTVYTSVTPQLVGDTIKTPFTYSLVGTDMARFTIDSSTGVVSMIARDFEAPVDSDANNTYEVGMKAVDTVGNSDTEYFMVQVYNVSEANVLTLTIVDTTTPENSDFTSAPPSMTGTPNGAVTYSITGDDASRFTVNTDTGAVTLIAKDFETPIDANADNDYKVTITGTDEDNNQAFVVFTIGITNVVDFVPAILGASGFEIDQDEPAGTAIHTIVKDASNNDDQNVIDSYTIIGDNDGNFSINAVGNITTAIGHNLDMDTKKYYALNIIATNLAGNSTAVDVNITITKKIPVELNITASTPTDGSTLDTYAKSVAPIVLKWTKDINKAGSKNVTIKSNDGTYERVFSTGTDDITISGDEATLNYKEIQLAYGKSYFIEIDRAAFNDNDGFDSNDTAGNGVWNFDVPLTAGPCQITCIDNCHVVDIDKVIQTTTKEAGQAVSITPTQGGTSYSMDTSLLTNGLVFSTITGEISGTPTIAERKTYEITVTDAAGDTTTIYIEVDVEPATPTIEPDMASIVPAHSANGDFAKDDIELTWNQTPVYVSGKNIKAIDRNSSHEMVFNDGEVSVSGDKTIFDMGTGHLNYGHTYYITIDSGAFETTNGKKSSTATMGLSVWSFTIPSSIGNCQNDCVDNCENPH